MLLWCVGSLNVALLSRNDVVMFLRARVKTERRLFAIFFASIVPDKLTLLGTESKVRCTALTTVTEAFTVESPPSLISKLYSDVDVSLLGSGVIKDVVLLSDNVLSGRPRFLFLSVGRGMAGRSRDFLLLSTGRYLLLSLLLFVGSEDKVSLLSGPKRFRKPFSIDYSGFENSAQTYFA